MKRSQNGAIMIGTGEMRAGVFVQHGGSFEFLSVNTRQLLRRVDSTPQTYRGTAGWLMGPHYLSLTGAKVSGQICPGTLRIGKIVHNMGTPEAREKEYSRHDWLPRTGLQVTRDEPNLVELSYTAQPAPNGWYNWRAAVTVRYSIEAQSLLGQFVVLNTGPLPFPGAFGEHLFFRGSLRAFPH